MHALPDMLVTGIKTAQVPTGFKVKKSTTDNECDENCDCTSDCCEQCRDD